MHSGNTANLPYIISRSDFSQLGGLYQRAAIALQETGKVLIIDDTKINNDAGRLEVFRKRHG